MNILNTKGVYYEKVMRSVSEKGHKKASGIHQIIFQFLIYH